MSRKPLNVLVGLVCLKVLWSLFQSLDDSSPMRFHVYYYLVDLAGKTDQLSTVYKDMSQVNKSRTLSCITLLLATFPVFCR